MSTRQLRYEPVRIARICHKLWYDMPESRLAIFADLVAVVGILAMVFTGRLGGELAGLYIVMIQGSMSAFLYGLARQIQQAESDLNDP